MFFDIAGEKKLRTDLVSLVVVTGDDAASEVLDKKFKKKRQTKRAFYGEMYFNDGKGASRKQFIESLGATCSNWNWSWSFVNADQKQVIFGAWLDHKEGNRALIFSNDWKTKNDKNRGSWPESRENIRLIEEEGYSLHVFTMEEDPSSVSDDPNRRRHIGAFHKDLTEAKLLREANNWYGVFGTES